MKMNPGYLILLVIVAWPLSPLGAFGADSPIYSPNVTLDTVPFYPGGTYDASTPKPNDFASAPIGQWPIRYAELVAYLQAVAKSSDRVRLETCGRTFEGRDLYNVFISSAENIKNLEDIRQRMDKVASADGLKTDADLETMVTDLPSVAWLGYSIHGDEISGTDAATQLIYQLTAGTDATTLNLLKNVIIIIVPSENPDGRERYLSMLQTYRGNVPNYDRSSLQHRGVWPWGRGNHYLFDLNRDLIVATQPETGGKLATILKWHPQLVVDAHEMGADGTFLFSPPREPINYNTPSNILKWWPRFAEKQGQALDSNGWPYYTGEWNDQWFPGYTSAWPSFFGAIGILYEQAGVDGSMVRQDDNYVLSYHEAINHHFTSSLSNLNMLAGNRVEILRDYARARREIVSQGKKSGLAFVIVPGKDLVKLNRCLDGLLQQGIRVERASQAFTLATAMNVLHEQTNSVTCPAGSYIIRTSQEQGALAKAVMEFDHHLKPDFLADERRELEKNGDTKMYEVSAWSVLLGFNVDAYQTTAAISVPTEPMTVTTAPAGSLISGDAGYGFVINMEGENTYKALNRLFENNLVVYASEKPFTLDNRTFDAGSLLLRKRGNPSDLATILGKIAGDVGINIYGTNTGMPSKGSYFGAPTFRLLQRPTVAILAGDPVDFTDFGSIWFAIDRQLEIPQSLISVSSISYASLSQYNVIILPDAWGGSLGRMLGKGGTERLKRWVSDGGTLICIGSSAAWAADTSTGLSQVRLRHQVLDQLSDYQTELERQVKAEAPVVDTMALWHPEKVAPPESKAEQKPASKEEIQKQDEWLQRFFPRGVIMRADLATDDWMAFGLHRDVPVMVYTQDAFMTGPSVNTTARFSVDPNELRLSGLLWPEARTRWAGTAYATHERSGNGQLILFGGNPNMRAYFYGTRQLLLNAVLYGPGMGSSFDEPYKQ